MAVIIVDLDELAKVEKMVEEYADRLDFGLDTASSSIDELELNWKGDDASETVKNFRSSVLDGGESISSYMHKFSAHLDYVYKCYYDMQEIIMKLALSTANKR